MLQLAAVDSLEPLQAALGAEVADQKAPMSVWLSAGPGG